MHDSSRGRAIWAPASAHRGLRYPLRGSVRSSRSDLTHDKILAVLRLPHHVLLHGQTMLRYDIEEVIGAFGATCAAVVIRDQALAPFHQEIHRHVDGRPTSLVIALLADLCVCVMQMRLPLGVNQILRSIAPAGRQTFRRESGERHSIA